MRDQDKTKEQLIAELEELRERVRSGNRPTEHIEAELHQQQEHLQRSEKRLRLALEAGRMGIWEWAIQTDQVVWSPGLETIHRTFRKSGFRFLRISGRRQVSGRSPWLVGRSVGGVCVADGSIP